MDVTSIRSELADVVGRVGYSAYSTLPGAPELPAIIVNSQDLIEYHQTLDGLAKVTLPITVLAASSDMESAQKLLNEAVSYKPDSLVQNLEAAEATNWSALVVVRAGAQYSIAFESGAKAFGVDITLTFLA